MDLKQRKLSKSEWESIEIPVSEQELSILRLISQGYHDVSLTNNDTETLLSHLKVESSPAMEEFLYARFFADRVRTLVHSFGLSCIQFGKTTGKNKQGIYVVNDASIVKLKSSDQIRMSRVQDTDIQQLSGLYEFVLLSLLEKMARHHHENKPQWMHSYYTLHSLCKCRIAKTNTILQQVALTILANKEEFVHLPYVVAHSPECIERNTLLLKHANVGLYKHQKDIYAAVKQPGPKLILYIAPTGTGKTLTPLGLSEQFRVIFVCAARHVGLALARSAISIHKKIAFAFGCSAAEDVRLHYFAVKECTRDKRNGRIKKVDNTVGDKVEIIICDVRSYLPAMYYMTSFNKPETIITYWDEPTITLDYETHPLHRVIKKNWKDNIIPNMVLSSATLPKVHELTYTVADFKERFSGHYGEDSEMVYSVVSHDCRKTIPLIDNDGYVVMPHYLHADYAALLETVIHCEQNLTLLRYLDLEEAAHFIAQTLEHAEWILPQAAFERSFTSIDDIDMMSIKLHYLKVLKYIHPEQWRVVYQYFQQYKRQRIPYNTQVDVKGKRVEGAAFRRTTLNQPTVNHKETCGVYVTTKDAYTLTDGPAIFIAQNLEKIAKFCIQQANIPASVMQSITEKIEYNNQLNQQIEKLEEALEFEQTKMLERLTGSCSDQSKEAAQFKSKKGSKNSGKIAAKLVDKTDDRKIAKMREDISTLYSLGKVAALDDLFVPNRAAHLEKWQPLFVDNVTDGRKSVPFTSDLDEQTIVRIMLLKDVENSWKVLLLLGIGVFTEHKSVAYTEIMKTLADQQKLYLIIGDSDYIYGTNYQFCHGYVSKDLTLTQEKIIQMLGRIGRGNVQQDYTIRFRDNVHIQTLFALHTDKPEVLAMNRLFHSKRLVWNGQTFDELEDEEEDMVLDGDVEEDKDDLEDDEVDEPDNEGEDEVNEEEDEE